MDTGTGGDGEKITGINSSGSETALLTINSEKKATVSIVGYEK